MLIKGQIFLLILLKMLFFDHFLSVFIFLQLISISSILDYMILHINDNSFFNNFQIG